ncbi:MAG TPA: hypothetical protein VNK41_07460 [Vicinamibacterales bacterium]|nr:hypothetical protein [Vicinamibacterales bacterium]
MIRRLALALSFIAAAGTAAVAADIGGRWQGTVDTPNGPVEVVYNFAVDGEQLTGTAIGPEGEVAIENGKISGDVVTFSITMHDGALVTHEGTLAGEQIAMTVRGPWGEFTFNVQRAPEPEE